MSAAIVVAALLEDPAILDMRASVLVDDILRRWPKRLTRAQAYAAVMAALRWTTEER